MTFGRITRIHHRSSWKYSLGLVISTIFTTEVNAHQVTMATFYPVLLLSGKCQDGEHFFRGKNRLRCLGIVWPLEGQPLWMRTVTKWLPMTKAIEAMRGILLKGNVRRKKYSIDERFDLGWSIEYIAVQQAFLITFAWSMFFLILTMFIFNCRRL